MREVSELEVHNRMDTVIKASIVYSVFPAMGIHPRGSTASFWYNVLSQQVSCCVHHMQNSPTQGSNHLAECLSSAISQRMGDIASCMGTRGCAVRVLDVRWVSSGTDQGSS